ncbi:MAG: STAS domain-containing protein [Spirochaetaceae bacterium]|nr:STAS domain-containing protein [Spirochaetaceae bacterium]
MDLAMEERPLPDGSWIVLVSGRLNGASAPEFKNRIRDMVDTGKKKLVVDMGGIVFIDSSGLSALISGLKCTRESGGWLKLAGLRDQPLSVIKLMMLDRIFEILPGQ